jgi:hypothetical protein
VRRTRSEEGLRSNLERTTEKEIKQEQNKEIDESISIFLKESEKQRDKRK